MIDKKLNIALEEIESLCKSAVEIEDNCRRQVMLEKTEQSLQDFVYEAYNQIRLARINSTETSSTSLDFGCCRYDDHATSVKVRGAIASIADMCGTKPNNQKDAELADIKSKLNLLSVLIGEFYHQMDITQLQGANPLTRLCAFKFASSVVDIFKQEEEK